ncbi:MAG TPA: ABC transporter ATP-binding protein [Ilumatobacteraceae bacterium]|nr:ABC transporter ATP-binding protein [Ilumatobacteraceae bacterium]HRB02889.1 ABC transporter ATP-binding protein [Ilumatobacteraceae bacterium]
MTEPLSRWSAVETIGRGVKAAPALRTGFGLTLALATVGAAGRVVIPILVQQAIDRGLRPDGVKVATVTTMAAIAFVVIVLATWAQRTAVARLGRRSEEALYGLRVRLFEHIHRLSIADHSEERKGALVARVTSDVETLAQFFQWGGLAWLLDGTLMLMVAGVMLAYDWVLAIVAFIVAAPLGYVLRRVQSYLSRAYDVARGRNADVMTQISELVAGAETLRAYDAGAHFAAQVEQASHERSNSFIRASTIGAFLFPSGEVFSVFTVSAVVGVGVLRGPGSGLTAGAMVGFLFLTYKFLEPIAEFTEVLDQTQTAVAGLRRVLGVLEIPIGPPEPEVPLMLPAGSLAVTLDRVDFSYRSRGDGDEPPVLLGVSAHIPAGQQVAVVGETGSGKTTLGRLIARLADPTAGTVLVGGVPLTRVANTDLRTRLTVVPQEPFLFEGSIAANLSFAKPKLSMADLEAAIDDLDLRDWLDTLPDGIETEVGQRGTQLSAGERQLVALIRASLIDPAVLVLDEATSSVDPLTEVRLSRALEKLASGRTTIAIAHRLSTAARADRVLVLEHGRLVQDGAHNDLVLQDGAYARMYEAWVTSTSAI